MTGPVGSADIAGLADFGEHPPPATMQFQRDWIDECYAGDDVSTILRRLLEHPAPSAQETGEHLSTMAPTSLKVTLAAIRRAASMTLDEVLAQDMRVCVRFLHHHDLAEGIRARLIDRDSRPRWDPPRLADVTDEQVQEYFAPLDRRGRTLAELTCRRCRRPVSPAGGWVGQPAILLIDGWPGVTGMVAAAMPACFISLRTSSACSGSITVTTVPPAPARAVRPERCR